MQSLAPPTERAESAPVRHVIARDATGIGELLAVIRAVFEKRGQRSLRAETWALRLREMLREDLLASLPEGEIESHADRVATRMEDPYTAVEALRDLLIAKGGTDSR
jgi:putative protein kinase ArgK-like GTPase of G3E family